MPMDPWNAVEKQRDEVIDDPPSSFDEFKKPFTGWAFFKEAFLGSQGDDLPRIPTTYYTKPCAWASDYPFSYRRVLVFLNPGGLADAKFNGSLDEYICREFGCSRETFIKLVADGWVFPMLTTKENYPTDMHDQVVGLFNEITTHNKDAVPRFVKLVDYALGAAALDDSTNTDWFAKSLHGEFIELDKTHEDWAELLPWSNLPRTEFIHRGVRHPDFREYVTERAAKLELAGRYFSDEKGISAKVDSLREQARDWEMNDSYMFPPIPKDLEGDVEIPPLLRDTYTAWNLLGTPMYYCDFSGTTDMGKTAAQDYGGLVKRTLDRVRSMATELKRLQSYAVRELDSTTVGFLEGGTLDRDVLLGISPEVQREYNNAQPSLEKRVVEHDRYYGEVRDQLLDRRNDTELSTYREVIADHNEAVASDVELGGFLSGQAQKVARWTGVATTVFTSIQPLLSDSGVSTSTLMSILAWAELVGRGLNVAGNVVSYMGEETIDQYEIPRPDDVRDVNLGSMDFWQVHYRGRSTEERIEYLADPER